MIERIFKLPKSMSFILLGARATGKSTLLKSLLQDEPTAWYDLLNPNLEARLTEDPMLLERELLALRQKPSWVIIDEVQKCPAILNVVHRLIENHGFRFALTGSSARKLKRGSANLLAGRALQKFMFPVTFVELGEAFDLDSVLRWGSLPQVFSLDEEERSEYLMSYANTYIKEEILVEQLVRKLPPFRKFLNIASQTSGKIVNYSNIAKDIGSDSASVKNYFSILEDTLVGFMLEPFHESVRKRQRKSPKFYFFDLGVNRALNNLIDVPVKPGTSDYGMLFEQFIIVEFFRLSHCMALNWKFSYVLTKEGAEIDLIIERPGEARVLLEIKSKSKIYSNDLRHLVNLGADIENSQTLCLSNDPSEQILDGVRCMPWRKGFEHLGLSAYREKLSITT